MSDELDMSQLPDDFYEKVDAEAIKNSQAKAKEYHIQKNNNNNKLHVPSVRIDNEFDPNADPDKPKVDTITWLIQNPDFDERPATIEEFLGPGYLDIDRSQNQNLRPGVGIRVGVKQALIDIFGEDIDPDNISVARRAMFSGGIGVGKSTLASIALTYMVHWVSCLNDPQGYFELLPGSPIAFMIMSTRKEQAKEVLFGKVTALVENSQWFKENAMPNQGKGESQLKNQLRFPKFIWLVPGTSLETAFEGYDILGGVIDEMDCVDEETEILTKSGWVKHDKLNVGDDVLTLNHETGLSEWNECLEIRKFDPKPKNVLHFEGKEFSAVTTLGHKWPVVRPRMRGGKKYMDRIWTTSESMGFHDRITRSAVNNDIPKQAKYSDSLVELVAWFYTEGTDAYNNGKTAYITQSHIMNGSNVARISRALTDIFGEKVDKFPRTGTRTDGIPRWRTKIIKNDDPYWGDSFQFVLNVDAGKIIQDLAPNKVPSNEFLLSLTDSQLELFINISMLADNNGEVKFSQKRKDMAEAFAFACILSGRSVSLRQTNLNTYPMWTVTVQKKGFHVPVNSANKDKIHGMKITKEYQDAMVWCPVTKNHSWLARRNGTIYFTGNSHKVTDEKDYAEAGWSTIAGRIASRFTNPTDGDHRGLLMAMGQMKKQDGFAARKKAELEKDDKAVVVMQTIWESRGWDYYRSKKTGKVEFFYFDLSRKVVVPPLAAEAVQSEQIIKIPKAYTKDFELDPVKALRDLAGIPPAVEDPFISAVDRIDEAQDKWQERYADLKYTVNSDIRTPAFHPDFRATDAIKRVIHVDLAYSSNGDAMGLAMGHIPEIVEVDNELKPYIVIDAVLRMRASGGTPLMLADIRQIIYYLHDDLKFKLGVVTFDGFQSQDSMQIMRQKRYNVDELSVDRNKGPYEDLRQAIYERRIEFPRYMTYLTKDATEKVNIIKKELSELTDVGQKIDHPPKNGSKDCADAIAGVTYVLMGNSAYRRGAARSYRRNMPKMDNDNVPDLGLAPRPVEFDINQGINKELKDLDNISKQLGLPKVEHDPFARLHPGPQV